MLVTLLSYLLVVNVGIFGAFTAPRRAISIHGTSLHWAELTKLDGFRYEIDSFVQFNDRIFMITKDSRVYVRGKFDEYALLGLGEDVYEVSQPTEIVELSGKQVMKVCSGHEHTMALTATGNIWAWGLNDDGKLGLGNTSSYYTPVFMPDVTDAVDIVCGTHSSYYLDSKRHVFAFGYNHKGQLGIGSNTDTASPTQLALDDIVSLVVNGGFFGYYDAIALSSNGQVFTWGEQSGKSLPLKIDFENNLGKMVTSTSDTFFILSGYGQIFKVVNGSAAILFYQGDVRFQAIWSDQNYDFLVAESSFGEVYVWKNVNYGGDNYQKLYSISMADSFGIFTYPPWMSFMIDLVEDGGHEARVMNKMFNNQAVSDFQVVVESKTIFVNRDVLIVTSDYMKKQFDVEWRTKPIVTIEGQTYRSYYNYLNYLYTNKLKITREEAVELMALATVLNEKRLKQRCHDLIIQSY